MAIPGHEALKKHPATFSATTRGKSKFGPFGPILGTQRPPSPEKTPRHSYPGVEGGGSARLKRLHAYYPPPLAPKAPEFWGGCCMGNTYSGFFPRLGSLYTYDPPPGHDLDTYYPRGSMQWGGAGGEPVLTNVARANYPGGG